jgi:hypothetical protein
MQNEKLTIGSDGAVLDYVAKPQAVLLKIAKCKLQIEQQMVVQVFEPGRLCQNPRCNHRGLNREVGPQRKQNSRCDQRGLNRIGMTMGD